MMPSSSSRAPKTSLTLVTPPLSAASAPAFARIFADVLAAAPIASAPRSFRARRRGRRQGDRRAAAQVGRSRRLRAAARRRPAPRGAARRRRRPCRRRRRGARRGARQPQAGADRRRRRLADARRGHDRRREGRRLRDVRRAARRPRRRWRSNCCSSGSAGGRRSSRRHASPTPNRSRRREGWRARARISSPLDDAIWSAPSPAEAARALHAALAERRGGGAMKRPRPLPWVCARARPAATAQAASPAAPAPAALGRRAAARASVDAAAPRRRQAAGPGLRRLPARQFPVSRLGKPSAASTQNPRDAAAMTLIGVIYRDGAAVGKNDLEASRWFRLASNLGDPQAAYELGALLLEGAKGLPKDRDGGQGAVRTRGGQEPARRALQSRRHGARRVGRPQARFCGRGAVLSQVRQRRRRRRAPIPTASCCAKAKACAQNVAEGARWLKRASDAGVIAGQVEYAIMLFNGDGVPKDEAAGGRHPAHRRGEGQPDRPEPARASLCRRGRAWAATSPKRPPGTPSPRPAVCRIRASTWRPPT